MPELLPVLINRKVTEAIEQNLRSLQAPEADRDLRALLLFLLRRPAELHQMVKDVWQLIINEKDIPQETYRAELLKACEDSVVMLDLFVVRMDAHYGSEWPVSRADLETAVAGVQQIKSDLQNDGLWFFPGAGAEPASELVKKEYADLDDAFAFVAGVSKEEWSKRVRARRQAHGIDS